MVPYYHRCFVVVRSARQLLSMYAPKADEETEIIIQVTNEDGTETPVKLIKKAGGRAKVALVMHHARVNAARARELLIQHKGLLRAIVGDLDLAG